MNQTIIEKLIEFRKKRDWEKYHTPGNLAQSIVIEAAELLECFQWGKNFDRENVACEIADIFIYLAYLCHDLNFDLDIIVRAKIMINEAKYPEDVSHEW
jgi:dCTP diphosphatase